MKINTLIVSTLLLSGCATITASVPNRESALTSLSLDAADREGILQAIDDDEHYSVRVLLSARKDINSSNEYGRDPVALTFGSPDCDGRVRETASVTRNASGWHLSRGERLLGEVVLRGPITCRDADAALAAFAAERGGLSESLEDWGAPDAVGLAYSFIAAAELGGKDEQLLAVLLSRDGSQRIVLIRKSKIVEVRRRFVT